MPKIGRRWPAPPRSNHAAVIDLITLQRVRPASVDHLWSGIASRDRFARAACAANFTGGRSWNMKSHFQRSDGFEACSQCAAATGRANVSVGQPGVDRIAGHRGGEPARIVRAARVRHVAPSARPTFTNTCQSSCASPGGVIDRRRGLQPSLRR